MFLTGLSQCRTAGHRKALAQNAVPLAQNPQSDSAKIPLRTSFPAGTFSHPRARRPLIFLSNMVAD